MRALLWREIRLAARAGSGAATGVLFYLAVVVIVPFAMGPDLNLLSRLGPAVLWIGALLAMLLGLDRLFQSDRDDGSLPLLLMSSRPLEWVIATKCLAHWVTTGLPLVLATPLFGLLLNMSPAATLAVMATLLAGSPAISFIGAAGAAVTVTLARGGLLIAILVLPLSIPVLIFGVMASYGAVEEPAPFTAPFLLLCAMALFFSVLGPISAAWALRHGTE
jgi:heme exporter protein B